MIVPPFVRALYAEASQVFATTPEVLVSHSKPRLLLEARVSLAKAMRSRGYSTPRIGQLMNRDPSTIKFYLGDLAKKQPVIRPRVVIVSTAESPSGRKLIPYAGADREKPRQKLMRKYHTTCTTQTR
jgi:hypothetical protein